MIHGHELREGTAGGNEGTQWRGGKGEKIGTTVIANSIKYIKNKNKIKIKNLK